jgi:hypothetical protein
MAMSATKVVPPLQATRSFEDVPVVDAQFVRGLLFSLPLAALLWFLIAALALAVL